MCACILRIYVLNAMSLIVTIDSIVDSMSFCAILVWFRWFSNIFSCDMLAAPRCMCAIEIDSTSKHDVFSVVLIIN